MKDLSRRQRSILEYIETFLDENDYPPTIRDIQGELGISSTSVVDYNLKVLEAHNLIRRNRNISRGIELVGRGPSRRNVVAIPLIGQIAAGQPIPVPDDLGAETPLETIELSTDIVPDSGKNLFALRVKGHSMVDSLINDGDVVLLKQQETCENGDTVAVWLREEKGNDPQEALQGRRPHPASTRQRHHGPDLHPSGKCRNPGQARDRRALIRLKLISLQFRAQNAVRASLRGCPFLSIPSSATAVQTPCHYDECVQR